MSMEYKLIEQAYSAELTRAVMQHLQEGWDLYGNPFAVEAEYDGQVRDIHFFQAVIRPIDTGLRMGQERAPYVVQAPILEDFEQLGRLVAGFVPG